jgi:23S rRNA (adenine2503-C2)-methyltransferase
MTQAGTRAMRIVGTTGRDDIARAYIAEMRPGRLVEFCESVDPPIPRHDKWVLIVSTMFGCPVGCQMCDAGGHYRGNLSAEEILGQIDFLIGKRFPDRRVDVAKFKIQFARMGEPALNPDVIEVLRELPKRYDAPGLMPSMSSVAPSAGAGFFEALAVVKSDLYDGGRFQLQFSIHSTDEAVRDRLIPVKKWSFAGIAEYGEVFYRPGDRKVTLNFALAGGIPVDPEVLLRHFDPERFLLKITPLNPTYRAVEHSLTSGIDTDASEAGVELIEDLRSAGYQVLLSIGEPEENLIGSNCGQFVLRHLKAQEALPEAYTYNVRNV